MMETVGSIVWTGDNVTEVFSFLGITGDTVRRARGVGMVMDDLIIDRFYGVGLSVRPGDEIIAYSNGAISIAAKAVGHYGINSSDDTETTQEEEKDNDGWKKKMW